ncbi:GGDEF domain-containing protein [Paracidovorax avenae]|uniref:GGDEF domain-containing protein n=1 Tax=Paracidovorax avenae TaxID=80867 RepID=UPI000D2203FC|nr:GGDEF domain-containing protein [Paracidovorax avenae]AVS79373.1 GGDEF domain-containing protein [Paracidovorax avenae]
MSEPPLSQVPARPPYPGGAPLGSRLLDALLTTEPRQRIRLAMAGLAALLMACCIAAMHIAVGAGLAQPGPVRIWTALSAGGLLVVYALIRSGISQRWSDPSLTLPQIVYAIACNAAAYAIGGQARGIALPILAVILMFGMFGLSTRQMFGVMLYAMAAFGLATVSVELRDEPGHSSGLSVAYGIMTAVVLLGSTFLTTRLQATREDLRRQKHDLARALEHIRELATHDELTGLLNRRHMLELMRLEQRRVSRSDFPLVIALLDVDHFKAVNDTHGHAAGDRVLQAFAQAVRRCVRDGDVISRWGGEEFVLMLCNTPPEAACALLERVREAVAALSVPADRGDGAGASAGHLRITVSIGFALHRPRHPIEETLERADRALYAAKQGGRNRTVEEALDPDTMEACKIRP